VLAKETTLKCLGEEVRMHVLSWTIADNNVARIDPALFEKMPEVNMLGSLGARLSAILRQQDSTLVVLVKDIFSNGEPLCLQEIPSPQDIRDDIMDPNQFTLGGAS
jgi:hypothetical protein